MRRYSSIPTIILADSRYALCSEHAPSFASLNEGVFVYTEQTGKYQLEGNIGYVIRIEGEEQSAFERARTGT